MFEGLFAVPYRFGRLLLLLQSRSLLYSGISGCAWGTEEGIWKSRKMGFWILDSGLGARGSGNARYCGLRDDIFTHLVTTLEFTAVLLMSLERDGSGLIAVKRVMMIF
jgi:hypothetical protein